MSVLERISKSWPKGHKALWIKHIHYINVVATNNWAHWLSELWWHFVPDP